MARPDGLLIEGGPRRHWFTGTTAATILPRLLGLLGEGHGPDVLMAETQLDSHQLAEALRLLDEHGLLDGPPNPGAAEHVDAYFSRMLPKAGGYRSSGELLAALHRATVVLTGDSPVWCALAADLRESGVGSVERDLDAVLAGPAGPGQRLVVVHDLPNTPDTLWRTVAACRPLGLPVLRMSADAVQVQIGPVFDRQVPLCPRCLRTSLRNGGWSSGHLPDGPDGDAVTGLSTGLVAGEILARVAHTHRPGPPARITRVTLADLGTEARLVVPEPDCHRCGLVGDGGDEAAATAEAYEWWMRARGCEPTWTGRPSPRETRRLAALQTRRPVYWTSPRFSLPADDRAPRLDGVFGDPAAAPRPMDRATLAAVLARVAGRRAPAGPEGTRRWTPTGGNLASVAAYVVTAHPADGVSATCFRYDDLKHELVALHTDRVSVPDALAGTDLSPDGLDAVLVLVGEVGRLGLKYGDFAYRLAHLDAGCAAMQLAAVTHGYGIVATLATCWDGRLAGLLDLNRHREIVTVVAGLTGD